MSKQEGLTDRLRSALALAAIQNSPLAAVPVGDVRSAVELANEVERFLDESDHHIISQRWLSDSIDSLDDKLRASIEAEEGA